MQSFIQFIYSTVDELLGYAETIWSSFGFSFISVLTIFVVCGALYKFVLSPYITGSGSSDNAKRRK